MTDRHSLNKLGDEPEKYLAAVAFFTEEGCPPKYQAETECPVPECVHLEELVTVGGDFGW